MHAAISAIEFHLPPKLLSTRDLALEFPEWSIDKIDRKTGISVRHLSEEDECASDLAVIAAEKLFRGGACRPEDIDFVVFCSQSPDYLIPTTACSIQHRLGLRKETGAFDINLGCSGFVYGLSVANGLLATSTMSNVLLLTAETYTKYVAKADRVCRPIFSDGAAATLIKMVAGRPEGIGPFVFGTDGSGIDCIIREESGSRRSPRQQGKASDYPSNEASSYLRMNGAKTFEFAVTTVPSVVNALLDKARLTHDDVALYVFHQANAYVLQAISSELGIPEQKMQMSLETFGNTVSSTIPIALKEASKQGRLVTGDKVVLVGFGVGWSWAATLVIWSSAWSNGQ